MTHICVANLIIIGSDNGLSPGRCEAIISTNAGILLIGPIGTNVGGILIKIITFSFTKMRSKMSCVKRRPYCLGLNVLTHFLQSYITVRVIIIRLLQMAMELSLSVLPLHCKYKNYLETLVFNYDSHYYI